MGDIIQDESKEYLINLATNIASGMGLSPFIILGICERESTWDPWITRLEPAFKIKYVDPLRLPEPEATQRSTSWGLMQLMGQSVREIHYVGPIPELLDPELNLMWGCRLLEHKMVQASGILADALEDWNGRSNPNYAAEVLELANKYIK